MQVRLAPLIKKAVQKHVLARQSIEENIVSRLAQASPDIKVSSVQPSPIAGLYQVQTAAGILWVAANGEKFIAGDMYNLEANGISKWIDPAVIAERKSLLAAVDPKDSILFKAEGKTKAVVYVFTDVDCGYCRKLNSQMSAYNQLGIEIRYLAYPRAGIQSESADKLITAWCSVDKQQALTLLKEEKQLPKLSCNNPVAAQYALGGRLGIKGTPSFWLQSGELKSGYLSPEELAKLLRILMIMKAALDDSYGKPGFKPNYGKHHLDVFAVTEAVLLDDEVIYRDGQWVV